MCTAACWWSRMRARGSRSWRGTRPLPRLVIQITRRPGRSLERVSGRSLERPGDATVSSVLRVLFAPGFFASSPVHVALAVGGIAALVSGVVGTFTVLRGQSYSGHALADLSVTGGSATFLASVSPLWGFAGTGVIAAGIMDMIGIRRPRGRDLATGIV